MNKPKKKPVTEEVKKWSIDFMKSVETEGYESMYRKLNELTPELMVSVLEYLRMITDYCVENDLKDFLEGVNTYNELIKEVKIKEIWKPRSIFGSTRSCGIQTHTNRSEIPVYEKLVG